MELNELVLLGNLLDIYGNILTDKKKEILGMYVLDNMSYQEIAENLHISKPAVLDSIRVATKKLNELEQKLGFLKFITNLQKIVDKSTDIKKDLEKLLKE